MDMPNQWLNTWIQPLTRSLPTLYPFHNHQQNVNISLGVGPREWNNILVMTTQTNVPHTHTHTHTSSRTRTSTHTHTRTYKYKFFREKKKLKIFAYKLPGEQQTRQANSKLWTREVRIHEGLSNRSDWCTYVSSTSQHSIPMPPILSTFPTSHSL